MNQIEADMAYMISSGQWWLNEKWVFGVFPLIAIVLAVSISRYKEWDLEQLLITAVFSWIVVCIVGIFIYHTTISEMLFHVDRWIDVFRPTEDNSGLVFKASFGYVAFWIFIFIVFIGISWLMYEDLKPKKSKV